MKKIVIIAAVAVIVFQGATSAFARFITINGRWIVEESLIQARFFPDENDNLVRFELRWNSFEGSSSFAYKCNEPWDWPKVEAASALVAKRLNEGNQIWILEVLKDAGYEPCESV
jgi:hypothetical protein